MHRAALFLLITFTILLLCVAPGVAQRPCDIPQQRPASDQANIFSPQQAEILGDIVAAHVMREYRLVNDPALNAYIQAIADRMASLAGVGKVHVELFDIPDVNAYTFPGGRILVSRKLIAYARSEDEVAGVLAHEFGHVLSRDPERTMSLLLDKVLNVTAVTDRRDIEDKYNRLIENEQRKPIKTPHGESDQQQEIADRYAVWLMARAGYDPQAYTQLWDRWNELNSHAGSWLSDMFGTTKPGAKRLRIALKTVASISQNCKAPRATTDEQFKAWQRAVVEASRSTGTTTLSGVIKERKLEPALRTDITHLKFSPDGKWILAQDEGSVFVFSREPLAFKFRINASEAAPARFSPDSTAVVFDDINYRVERWNIASEKREWVKELALTRGCAASSLSPDGLYVACATPEADLRVIEVSTGNVVFEKKRFYDLSAAEAEAMFRTILAGLTRSNVDFALFSLTFSPDGHYLIAARGPSSLAVDLQTKTVVPLPASIRDRLSYSYAFLGNDRIIGIHGSDYKKSGIVKFPSGELVTTMEVGGVRITGATHGDRYVMVRGRGIKYAVAVFDLQTQRLVLGNRVAGLDVYDDYYVTERKDGEIAVCRFGDSTPIAMAQVPPGPLGRLRAADASPDFRMLAISGRSRGAVWDLESGERKALTRGFRSAYVGANELTYLDFPRDEEAARTIVQLDAPKQNVVPLVGIREPQQGLVGIDADDVKVDAKYTIDDSDAVEYGPYLAGWRTVNKTTELVIRDVATTKELWSRPFPEVMPRGVREVPSHDALVFVWSMDQAAARKLVEGNAALKTQYEGIRARKAWVDLLEVVDLANGKDMGYVLIDLGYDSFLPSSFVLAGKNIVVGDNRNRTVVYSLETGQEIGHTFGSPLAASKDGAKLLVENKQGHATVFSPATMKVNEELVFPAGISYARFSGDDQRLFVLTADHTAYTLNVGTSEQKVAAAGK